MKFGLYAINGGPCSHPKTAARIAQAAEAAGFELVWTGEHVVLPDPQVPPAPPPNFPILDPAVALAFIAAQTKTIRLGTGIIILPQRNPLVLAKELATLASSTASGATYRGATDPDPTLPTPPAQDTSGALSP